jgi:hypothetical protein
VPRAGSGCRSRTLPPVSTAASTSDSDRGWKWWLGHVVVPLLVPLIGAIAIFSLNHEDSGKGMPNGTITFPKDGSTVARDFTSEGTLGNIADDRHVWLVVESGGLLFPKEPEIASQPHWIMQSFESDVPPGGRFSLVLLSAGDAGERQIRAWLIHGETTGSYPGLERIKDGETLDTAAELLVPR